MPFAGLTIDLDVTYLLVLTLFLLPLIILNTLVFRPFMKLFEDRHEHLEGALERAGKSLEESEKKAHDFEEKIKVATGKGLEARNRIRAEAQKAMSERIEQERTKLDAKLEGELKDIQGEHRQAMAAVDAEARRLAELTAQKLLGRAV